MSLAGGEVELVQVNKGVIEIVNNFTYLGSCISTDCEIGEKVPVCIGKASKALGYLHQSIFRNRTLSVDTKRSLYKAVVMPIILYGSETWMVKSHNLRHLEIFLNRCVRSIEGVTRHQQWQERISSCQLAEDLGMEEKYQTC